MFRLRRGNTAARGRAVQASAAPTSASPPLTTFLGCVSSDVRCSLVAATCSWRSAILVVSGSSLPSFGLGGSPNDPAGAVRFSCGARNSVVLQPTQKAAPPNCSYRSPRGRLFVAICTHAETSSSVTHTKVSQVTHTTRRQRSPPFSRPRRQLRTQTEAEVDWRTKTSCGAWMPRREVSSAPCRACCCSVGCFRRRCVARATSAGTL